MEKIGTKICKKGDIGVHNNLFGGTMLSWLDEAAFGFCAEVCGSPNLVTLKMDEMIFKVPVKENNIIKIYGEVLKFGRTSLEIRLEARKFNVHNGEEIIVTETKMVFVQIDSEGTSIPIPQHIKDLHSPKL